MLTKMSTLAPLNGSLGSWQTCRNYDTWRIRLRRDTLTVRSVEFEACERLEFALRWLVELEWRPKLRSLELN